MHWKAYFSGLYRAAFYLKHYQTSFVSILIENKKKKKLQIFDQNHELTSLEECQFLDLVREKRLNFLPKPWTNGFRRMPIFWFSKKVIFWSILCCFLCIHYHSIFVVIFSKNKKKEKISNFRPKPWNNPSKRIQIFPFLISIIFLVYIALLSI